MPRLKQPEVSQLIRELRQRRGITQEQLAAQIGVVFSTLNRWERGHANPFPLGLSRIQALLLEMGEQGQDLLDKYFSGKSGG